MLTVPDARVRCARFRGEDREDILDHEDVEGTILDAIKRVPLFIARNTRHRQVITGMQRKDLSEYSTEALREILINALAHSDYSIPGSCIRVAIFSNRIEIENPGMLPFGFTLEDLKLGVSRVRNRVIVRFLSQLGLMEEWGSGYRKVFAACQRMGYPIPEWQEFGNFMRVTLYPHPTTPLVQKEASQSPRREAILQLFKQQQPLSFRQILEALPTKISERALRYDLARLRQEGVLLSRGTGRATLWQRS